MDTAALYLFASLFGDRDLIFNNLSSRARRGGWHRKGAGRHQPVPDQNKPQRPSLQIFRISLRSHASRRFCYGNPDVAEALLMEYGADSNAFPTFMGGTGMRPAPLLQWALQAGLETETRVCLLELLLHYNASPDPPRNFLPIHGEEVPIDWFSLTVLHFACKFTDLELVDQGAPSVGEDCALSDEEHDAPTKKQARIVNLLLRRGADTTTTDYEEDSDEEEGCTPLHYTCIYGFVGVVRGLLADGRVDVNAGLLLHSLSGPLDYMIYQDINYPPLQLICSKDKAEIAELPIAAGTGVRARDRLSSLPIRGSTHPEGDIIDPRLRAIGHITFNTDVIKESEEVHKGTLRAVANCLVTSNNDCHSFDDRYEIEEFIEYAA
ncbi:hypothetical protein DL768_007002 [Monosporascus sp. mg162]|nr:hypothetical protein DL768_007002 [Monosporascus sp. mg162]